MAIGQVLSGPLARLRLQRHQEHQDKLQNCFKLRNGEPLAVPRQELWQKRFEPG